VLPPDSQRMVQLVSALAPSEGYNLTALADIRLLRSNRPLRRTPVLYEPGIVIVCQGCKRGYLGQQLYVYDAQHYLVVSVPVPFTMETEASADEPMLAVYMRLDLQLASEVALHIDQTFGPSLDAPQGMFASPLDATLSSCVLRLVETLSVAGEAHILGPLRVRELYYHVLRGPQGGSLRAALRQQGYFGQVSQALQRIHAEYHLALDVPSLAATACMSVPGFHRRFRQVTQVSPVQYLKSTRLHQARLLMLRGNLSAASAAFRVGYQSPSQFSRDFKRFFGRPPQAEVQWIRATYAIPEPLTPSPYVSSH